MAGSLKTQGFCTLLNPPLAVLVDSLSSAPRAIGQCDSYNSSLLESFIFLVIIDAMIKASATLG